MRAAIVVSWVSVASGAQSYDLCSEINSGGHGKVYRAARGPAGSCSKGSSAIVKCGPVGFEKVYTEEWDKMSRLQVNAWAIKPFDFFYNSETQPCIGMEELGVDLSMIRRASGQKIWSNQLIATIGLGLVDALTSMHLVHNYVHTDLHLGNVATRIPSESNNQFVSDTLVVFDYGDMKPAANDARDTREGLIRADMQQALLSLRYLIDGEEKFSVAKRYSYNKDEACKGGAIDSNLCNAIDYVFSIKPKELVDHAHARQFLMAMLGTTPYQQRILWDADVIASVTNEARRGGLKRQGGLMGNPNPAEVNAQQDATTKSAVKSVARGGMVVAISLIVTLVSKV